MPPRTPTAPLGFAHDAVCCQACRQDVIQLRLDHELLAQQLETEKEYGKTDANELTKLEGRVESLEARRQRESGRNEILDQQARDKATQAQGTADKAHRRAGVATWAAGVVVIIEALERTGVLSAIMKKLGG